MNERIKELAVQSYIQSYGYDIDGFSGKLDEFITLFSELLITECAEYIDREYGYSEGESLLEYFKMKS